MPMSRSGRRSVMQPVSMGARPNTAKAAKTRPKHKAFGHVPVRHLALTLVAHDRDCPNLCIVPEHDCRGKDKSGTRHTSGRAHAPRLRTVLAGYQAVWGGPIKLQTGSPRFPHCRGLTAS